MRLDQYLVRPLPRLQPLRPARAIDAGARHRQRQRRPRPATRSATATAIRIWLPEPTHDAAGRRGHPARRPLRGRVPRPHQQAGRHGRPPGQGATGPARWSTPCSSTSAHSRAGQRRLPAGHRPPPRPRHQRRHPGRQGGADAPRPEPCSSSTARSSRSTSPSRPGVLDRDSDYIEGRIGHHPHDRVKMMVTDDERRGRQGRVQLLRGDRAVPRLHVRAASSRGPAGRTRSASTWRASAARCWPTRCTAAATSCGCPT